MNALHLLRFARNDGSIYIPRNDGNKRRYSNIMKPGFVYIMTNKRNSALYVGSTNNIIVRAQQHKDKINPKSFTARYNLDKLVYYEAYQMIGDAIGREKQLKGGSRAQKIQLIENINPEWLDLFDVVKSEFGDSFG